MQAFHFNAIEGIPILSRLCNVSPPSPSPPLEVVIIHVFCSSQITKYYINRCCCSVVRASQVTAMSCLMVQCYPFSKFYLLNKNSRQPRSTFYVDLHSEIIHMWYLTITIIIFCLCEKASDSTAQLLLSLTLCPNVLGRELLAPCGNPGLTVTIYQSNGYSAR